MEKKRGDSVPNKGIINKILHFLVHNSFMFTVAIMGVVHLVLLTIMIIGNVTPLIFFNLLSVIVYIFCTILCKYELILPVYVSILLEVTTFTIFETYYLGWRCGPYCFMCAIVPIIIYFGCFLFKGKKRWIIVVSLLLDFGIYAALFLIFKDKMPVYVLSDALGGVLVVFSSFVAIFSVIFYNVIYIYSSESEKVNLEQRNQQLSVDAQFDALTNLLNRRGFLPMMETLMETEWTRHFCVGFCDIDNFKRINDSYGHDCGDEVLRHITKLIKNEMTGCPICRWGGEEMVILMKDYDLAVAREKMEYVRKCVETNPTVFYNKRISVTITIGLEENKDIYKTPEEVIKVADERMYYGKQHGKNIVIYKDEET